MTAKDYSKLYFFIHSNREMTKELRWQMMSLMNYLPVCGVYDDDARAGKFTIYLSKMKELFEIESIDFFTLGDIYGFLEYEKINDNAFEVRIKWKEIDEYRTTFISKFKKDKEKDEINGETINKVLQMLLEGKIQGYKIN